MVDETIKNPYIVTIVNNQNGTYTEMVTKPSSMGVVEDVTEVKESGLAVQFYKTNIWFTLPSGDTMKLIADGEEQVEYYKGLALNNKIVVTAEEPTPPEPPKSDVNTLATLVVKEGGSPLALTPTFSADKVTYTATTATGTAGAITVEATATDTKAKVTGTGAGKVGANVVTCTSESGKAKEYTVTVSLGTD